MMAIRVSENRISARTAGAGGAVLAALVSLATAVAPAQAQQAQTSAAVAAQPDSPPASTAYKLGPNDAITVMVYGQEEFNIATRIKPDGTIVMPLVGAVKAEDETVITLADKIRQRLVSGNFLKDPIVNVEVNEYNSRYVRVVGKVGAPSLVPLDRSRHLLDVLLRSGWVRPEGSQIITIRRAADDQEIKVNSHKLALGETEDVLLAPGDTVYVAETEVVYLTGAVARPGPYPLKPGMTISELIAQAGGVGPTGSNGKVGLKRGDAKETKVEQSTELEAGDVVNVRERLF